MMQPSDHNGRNIVAQGITALFCLIFMVAFAVIVLIAGAFDWFVGTIAIVGVLGFGYLAYQCYRIYQREQMK